MLMITRAKQSATRYTQTGAVAIIVALALPVIIGMAGLALDLGKLFITKTELQNAADACALSAARELDGTGSQFQRAENSGVAIGELNRSFFQSTNVVLDGEVSFAESLNGAYLPTASLIGTSDEDAESYKFVRCEARRDDVPNFLIPVLGVLGIGVNETSDVAASAVASNRPGQTTCSLPIAVCSSDIAGKAPGTWISGVFSGGDGISGSFKWVDLTAPAGGAAELAGILNGSTNQDCGIDPGNEDIEAFGAITGIKDDYNTRFGIERGSNKGKSVPDLTGYGYYYNSATAQGNWPSKNNAYSDYVNRRSSNAPYQGIAGININNSNTILTKEELISKGKSRRVSVAPVVDCSLFGPGNPVVSAQSYACMFLLHPVPVDGTSFEMFLEYLGPAEDVGACNQNGLAGDADGIGPNVATLMQ
ncbi:MAG TPA: Tad domain-containing protein [Methylophilus sp.]